MIAPWFECRNPRAAVAMRLRQPGMFDKHHDADDELGDFASGVFGDVA